MIVRQGLRAMLGAEPDIEVIGEAANGRQAVDMMQKLHPNVVVMDIAMPLLNGLEDASNFKTLSRRQSAHPLRA